MPTRPVCHIERFEKHVKGASCFFGTNWNTDGTGLAFDRKHRKEKKPVAFYQKSASFFIFGSLQNWGENNQFSSHDASLLRHTFPIFCNIDLHALRSFISVFWMESKAIKEAATCINVVATCPYREHPLAQFLDNWDATLGHKSCNISLKFWLGEALLDCFLK